MTVAQQATPAKKAKKIGNAKLSHKGRKTDNQSVANSDEKRRPTKHAFTKRKFDTDGQSRNPDRKRGKFESSGKKPNKKPDEASSQSRHLKKKTLAEKRKKYTKPNFLLGQEVKVLWEKLRQKKLENEERSRVTSTILSKMKGKVPEMVNSHVMSRVLQTCLKYCTPEEKLSVYDELRPHFLEITQNTYSHHLVVKILDQAASDKNQLQKMITSLHGHVVTFLRHPVASAVVEHAYQLANNTQKLELVAEFFSPEYRLFKGIVSQSSCRLVDLLANEPASKRRSILEHMTTSLQPILEKGIVDHSIIHRVLVEYLSVVNKAAVTEVLQQLSGPLLVRMIHSKDGAKLGVTCVAFGTRKERKKIIKGLKGCAQKAACDQYGCTVLMTIMDLVDDTEIVNKFIMSELANNVKEVAFDRHGRRVFLHLLSPKNNQYVSADSLVPIQNPNTDSKKIQTTEQDAKELPKEVEKEDDDAEEDEKMEDEDDKEEEPVASKKDPIVRRKELLKASSLAEKLCEICVLHTGELLRSSTGKDLIYEVARGGQDGVLFDVASDCVKKVHKAIAELGAQPRNETENSEEHVFEQYYASRTIRKLILESAVSPDGTATPSFARVLWKTALKGNCKKWAKGHSEKVVSAFQLCADQRLKKEAIKELKPLIDSGLLQKRTDDSNCEAAK